MKKLITTLSIIIASLVLTTSSMAQSDEATIQATANVLYTITIEAVKGLEFGDVTLGSTNTVTADQTEAGQFNIFSGNQNTPFSVNWNAPSALTNATNHELTVDEFVFRGSATLDDNDTLFDVNNGDSFNISEGQTLDQLRSLYVGGTITVPNDAPGGSYSGEITVTVEVDA